jgi:DNA polymerase-3 subunit alpha
MAGTMDSLAGTRAEKFATIDIALKYGQQIQENKHRNQEDLFGQASNGHSAMIPALVSAESWTDSVSLQKEKEVLGLYLSGHPLLKYAEDLEEFSNFDFTENIEELKRETVRIGGSVQEFRLHFDRKNNQMAFFKLECLGGQAEILAFSSVFDKYKDLLDNDEIIFVSGRPTDTSDFSDLKIIADEIVALDKARDYYAKNVNIKFESKEMTPNDIDAIYALAQKYHGSCGLLFHISVDERKDQRIFANNIRVSSGREFLKKLRDIYGKDNIWVSN